MYLQSRTSQKLIVKRNLHFIVRSCASSELVRLLRGIYSIPVLDIARLSPGIVDNDHYIISIFVF